MTLINAQSARNMTDEVILRAAEENSGVEISTKAIDKIAEVVDDINQKIMSATTNGNSEIEHFFTFDEEVEMLSFVIEDVTTQLKNAGYKVKDTTAADYECELRISW